MKGRPPMTYTVLSDNTLNIQDCVTYIGVLKCSSADLILIRKFAHTVAPTFTKRGCTWCTGMSTFRGQQGQWCWALDFVTFNSLTNHYTWPFNQGTWVSRVLPWRFGVSTTVVYVAEASSIVHVSTLRVVRIRQAKHSA
jgi:hypothetical protein